MIVDGKEVKIVQIFPLENSDVWSGFVLGLGDDGVTYINNGPKRSLWEVYIKDRFLE